MAFAYGVFVIAATMPMLLYYFLPTAGHTQIMIVSEQMIVTTAPSIVSAILLVIGAIMLLMQGPGGRGLLIGVVHRVDRQRGHRVSVRRLPVFAVGQLPAVWAGVSDLSGEFAVLQSAADFVCAGDP